MIGLIIRVDRSVASLGRRVSTFLYHMRLCATLSGIAIVGYREIPFRHLL